MNQLKDSVVSEDVALSLRALWFDERKEGRDSSGSHGSSSHQSGAKARGAAAINTTSSLQPSGREKTSVTVDVDALAGSLEVNLRAASTAAGSSGGQSVRVASAAAGYGGGQSMRVETDGLQSDRGYGQPRAVPSSADKSLKDKMIFEQFEEVKPWDLSAYKSIRHASTDTWDLDHWKEGWVCRRHHKERKQPFHPVHRSTPVNTKLLEPGRVSVRFYGDGERQVVIDEWTAPRMSKGQSDRPIMEGLHFLQSEEGTAR